MVDKPTIIDGVDISKCNYFDCDSKECKAEYYVRYGYEIVKYDNCRENPDCYYKQLKRKEQALDEIEEYLDAQQRYFYDEDYRNLLDIINKAKEI